MYEINLILFKEKKCDNNCQFPKKSFVPLPRTQPDRGGRQITRTTSPLKTLQIVQQQEFGNINILQSDDHLVPPVNCSKQTSQLRLEAMILPSLLVP